MAGCRDLTDNEISLILDQLTLQRDKLLFLMGVKTGLRVTELLNLRVSDVYYNGSITEVLRFKSLKGNGYRLIPLHLVIRQVLVGYLRDRVQGSQDFLFKTKYGRLTRNQAWNILRQAYDRLKLTGKLGTHSMRKTFAAKVYKALEYDLVRTQKALGHKQVETTVKYLPIDDDSITKAILSD